MSLKDENVKKVQKAADPNARLLVAAEDGNLEALMRAIQEGADLGAIDPSNKHDALAMAAIQGKEECLKALLIAGASIEKDKEQTALHLAAQIGHPHCVRTLLEYDANVDAVTLEGWTPLHKAAYYGNTQCVRELVSGGCNLKSVTNKSFTAIHLAAMTDRAVCMEALCDSGVNINAVTSGGATSLHIASSWGHLATVKVLTKYPKELRDSVALTIKGKFKKDRIATVFSDLMFGRDADRGLKDNDGKRAVEVAAQKRQLKVVKFLTSLEEASVQS